ncbi:discoidin domain-containing protein [Phytohabitans sp. ZYX-F-186]|uniref:Discoidin domain-containing protein n=1 Tax=Phytohabitans maris TaxID=3071409 RepID=A0ABU0ZGM7_9ACTN|nr:discoidin domain-containing protein [Phytohabitans sp. ZYX-F-186]MDQ7906213.1 discoidin domain-containing protein [Phytohabitans sp. ZYX-F-186]
MRKPLAAGVVAVVTAALLASPASAAQTIGLPTFSGPAVPQPPVGYNSGNMMRAIYDAEASGTDFWVDRLLSRSGSDPSDADGGILMTRGRGAFMKVHSPSVIGFGGRVAYFESISDQNAYSVAVTPGTFTEQVSQRWQAPSHWKSVHTAGSIRVNQTKFITDNNVLVTNLSITNTGSASTTLQLRATSPYATTASGSELTGQRASFNSLTTLFPRLSGDSGFAVSSGGLNRSVTVGAGQTVEAKVQLGFVTDEIPESLSEYNAYRGYTNATAFATHVRAYNRWWADNVPYIDVPEAAIKKNVYYRWWLMRFNNFDGDIPGQTFQFPTSVEGALGYNNAIVLTQPMHIDDLKYLRDPKYAYGNWLNVGTVSRNGRYMDNPGDPANWNNSYTQYISEAGWRAYQIHGGQPAMLANFARYAEQDVKGQLSFYDHDNDGVIEYDWGALTGNDADAVSFHWRSGWLDRAEGAYVYSNALAAVQAYTMLGNTAKANEMQTIANRVRDGIINQLWNSSSQLLQHRHVATNTLVPWKEINNYYPYAVGLMPNTDQYRQALRLFDSPAEYPIFPFYTANQVDKAAAAAAGQPGSNNFSTINSTVQFRLYSSALRNYPNQWMTADNYKQLLYWNVWAQYVGGNTAWPDANEFWADWNGSSRTIQYRSWIHHNILGSSNWTVIEDVAGLRPRNDAQVELWPINIGWSYFAVNNLRYRDSDLSIVWDDPADGVTRYAGVPQGYSVFVNGQRAFTVDRLTRVVYNPATGAVSLPAGGSVSFNTTAPVKAPNAVAQGGTRIVDMFAKAGVDLTSTLPNLAQGATATASFTASGTSTGAAVDGFTINDPIWGAAGSPNSQDWYEINFGQARTVDELRLHFRDSRPQNSTYRAPSSYNVQYLSGSTWTNAGSQVKSPAAPRANYNNVRFAPVTTQRIRVQLTHASGSKAGLTEVKAYNRGGTVPDPDPDPDPPTGNLAGSATPSASYTSSWESVNAINDGVDPPSSNDTVNPRWGTWPNEGEQWAQLTWPSAVSLNRAEVYFFDDGQGIDLPASWKLQYWNGSAFVDIAASYPVAANQYNAVSFPTVSTTQLRVVLQSAADSVGLLEVKAFAPA